MHISTINEIPGKKISETLGIARGSTVRTRNVGKDIFAAFKNLIGGEVKAYTKLQADAREEALQRMIDDAKSLGANAVVPTIPPAPIPMALTIATTFSFARTLIVSSFT